MKLKAKSDLVRTRIESLRLSEGSSLSNPRTSLSKDATGLPEYIHAFEHYIEGQLVQKFQAYVSKDSITLRYESCTACFQPFVGGDQVEKAVQDLGRFLQTGYSRATGQNAYRQRDCRTCRNQDRREDVFDPSPTHAGARKSPI